MSKKAELEVGGYGLLRAPVLKGVGDLPIYVVFYACEVGHLLLVLIVVSYCRCRSLIISPGAARRNNKIIAAQIVVICTPLFTIKILILVDALIVIGGAVTWLGRQFGIGWVLLIL